MMGITSRVAMTGEVLGSSGYTLRLDSHDHCACKPSNHLGVFAEGAYSDDRIFGIYVDVATGSIIYIDPHRGQFPAQNFPGFASQFR